MKKRETQFLKSAVFPEDYPDTSRPEILLCGRSNAGKSSFLNALTGRDIAKVSQTPGKTRLLNFFDVGEKYRVVDAPGYGFASRSGDEQAGWQKLMETYMAERKNLRGVLLVIDCRRDWDEDERLLVGFCHREDIPIMVAFNKVDKLKPHEAKSALQKLQKASGVQEIMPVSAQTGLGVEEFEKTFFAAWLSTRKNKD